MRFTWKRHQCGSSAQQLTDAGRHTSVSSGSWPVLASRTVLKVTTTDCSSVPSGTVRPLLKPRPLPFVFFFYVFLLCFARSSLFIFFYFRFCMVSIHPYILACIFFFIYLFIYFSRHLVPYYSLYLAPFFFSPPLVLVSRLFSFLAFPPFLSLKAYNQLHDTIRNAKNKKIRKQLITSPPNIA